MAAGGFARAWVVAALLVAGPGLAAEPANPVVHHVIEATLDVPAQKIAVVDTVTLAAAPNAPVWRFLLHKNLTITAVRDGEGRELTWRESSGWNPRHFWRRPPYTDLERFEVAREVEVEAPTERLVIEYAGVIADSLHPRDTSYGRSSEWTSGRIVERGAYLHDGTFWVPWAGDGVFSFELAVTGPRDWRVVSQGELRRDEARGEDRRTEWSAPLSEQVFLVAGPYRVREAEHVGASGPVRVMTYCYADTGDEITRPYLDATGPALDRFAARFGPYPYSKFALVENYWQTGYGMPSFTFLGNLVIRLPFIVDTSYPHEILHNWWGNGVFVDAESGNWCEGLTTYCADYFAKEEESPEAARDYRRSTLVGYRDFAVGGGKDFALARFRERDSAATQAVGYGKTLMVFHMLRRRVGDDAFFASLARLFRSHLFRRAGWADVRSAFEAEVESGLEDWFTQWVARPGAPVISLESVGTRPREGGRTLVHGTIVQREPVFDLEVPVVAESEGGASSRELVRSRAARTPFAVSVKFVPATVRADPGFDVFRLLHPGEVPPSLSGVLGAERVRVVLAADLATDMRGALATVGREWAQDSAVVFVEEEPGGKLPPFVGGTWFFGEGSWAASFLENDLPPIPRQAGSLVAAGRLGGNPERPAALLVPESAAVVAAIARKIPHYSKYGFLRFEGTRNVAKGDWPAGESPLTVSLDAEGGR